jgi:hypothetical protein
MGNFQQGQTDFSKKKKNFARRQKTLRPTAEFGFILWCRFNQQTHRPWPAAAA